MPSVVVSLGIGSLFELSGIERSFLTSGLGAHLTWTLPFGLLIMFAVFNRFDKAYEEAARDLGASGVAAAVKLAEVLVGLGLRTSKVRGYAPLRLKAFKGAQGCARSSARRDRAGSNPGPKLATGSRRCPRVKSILIH